MRRVVPLALLLVVMPALGGCAALALPAASSAVVEGAGGLLKAGTEYTRSGTAYRTFALPLDEVRTTVLETFHRLDLRVATDEPAERGWRITAEPARRHVDVRLEAVSESLTRVRLVVKHGALGRDRSTTSEIIAQFERATEQRESAHAAASPRTAPAGTPVAPLPRRTQP